MSQVTIKFFCNGLYSGGFVAGLKFNAIRPFVELKSDPLFVHSIRLNGGLPGLGFLRPNFTSTTFSCSRLASVDRFTLIRGVTFTNAKYTLLV